MELAQQLIEIAAPGAAALRVWRLGEGVKAVSWLIEADGVDPVVAKFFRPESQGRMERELGFHQLCTLEDRRLPRLLGRQESIPGQQLGVVLTTLLMGQRLADAAGATEADKRVVYVDSSRFLRDLHSIELAAFGPLGSAAMFSDARSMAQELVATAIERRRRAEDDPALTVRLEGWASERADSIEGGVRPVLCHGDFSMWNMLVEWRGERHELTGIFDFESAYAGDPLMELASAWVLTDSWGSPGRPELEAIDHGYGDLRQRRSADFELYVALEKLKLWWYYAERGAREAAQGVSASLASQTAR